MDTRTKSERFLDEVCCKVRSQRERGALRAELSDHLEQTIGDLMRDTAVTREQAEEEAVARMGSAQGIARRFNKVLFFHAGQRVQVGMRRGHRGGGHLRDIIRVVRPDDCCYGYHHQ